MEKIPELRLTRWMTILREAEKDLTEGQGWWREKHPDWGFPPAETLGEIRHWLFTSQEELTK